MGTGVTPADSEVLSQQGDLRLGMCIGFLGRSQQNITDWALAGVAQWD